MAAPFRGRGTRRFLTVGLVVGVTLVALLIGTGLGTSSPHGAGDNGDGVRLYCGAGLVPATATSTANWQGVVVDGFRTGAPRCAEPVPSSARIPMEITVRLVGAIWHLSALGWFYVLVTVAGVGIAAAAAGARRPRHALVVLPVVLPLAVPSFSRFLLSTYSEPAGLVGTAVSLAGITAAVATDAHGRSRSTALALALVGGVVAATAKPAYVVVLLPALLVCVLVPPGGSRLRGALAALVAVAAAALPVATALSAQDRDYGAINTHNLVFTAVGPASGGDALGRIGLPPEAARALGTAYYPSGGTEVPDWDRSVGERWPELRSAARSYVLTHPRTALRMVDTALRATSDPRLAYLPSGLVSSPSTRPVPVPDVPVGEQGADSATLRAWSEGRPLGPVPLALLVLAAAVGVAALLHRPRRPASALVVLVVVAAATCLATATTAVLGDGFFEIAKHTWLSAYLAAVTASALVALALHGATRRWRRRTVPARPPTDPIPVKVASAPE